jgi:hypothetical protein
MLKPLGGNERRRMPTATYRSLPPRTVAAADLRGAVHPKSTTVCMPSMNEVARCNEPTPTTCGPVWSLREWVEGGRQYVHVLRRRSSCQDLRLTDLDLSWTCSGPVPDSSTLYYQYRTGYDPKQTESVQPSVSCDSGAPEASHSPADPATERRRRATPVGSSSSVPVRNDDLGIGPHAGTPSHEGRSPMTVNPARHGERQPVGDECQHLTRTQPHRLEPARLTIQTSARRRPTAIPARTRRLTETRPTPDPTSSR